MEDFASHVAIKHAETWEFFFCTVSFFVVVGSLSGGDVLGSGCHAEVVVEIATF
ncbi:hypothetical protein D3C78_1947550 [compost metagenome]